MLCQLKGSTGTLPFAGVDWQSDNILMLVEPCHWQGCHLKGCTGKVVISYARQSLPLAKLQWILDAPCNYAAGLPVEASGGTKYIAQAGLLRAEPEPGVLTGPASLFKYAPGIQTYV